MKLSARALRWMITLTAIAVLATTTAATLTAATPAEARAHSSAPAKKPTKQKEKAKAKSKAKSKKQLAGKLNINNANVKQLVMLPGVGPTKAKRVIDWRGKRGPFKRVKDLRRVKGFGYKILKKLAPYLTVSGQTTLHYK